ncbi:CidA/LrgA family protein [Alteromonas sp. W364]|uniref:CidA/LrgA family protein n=1 Tax=Alteromonas sp. W364 TaxID=3075610 RepID=UPI0028869CEF|nr:CidA/LrgA family protein [Alteromonas sp. W364]MDT0628960.1 CidA/LrgA family protein [Alteromonas sp. W364]
MTTTMLRGAFGFLVLTFIYLFAVFLFHALSLPVPPALIGILILFLLLLVLKKVPLSVTTAARPLLAHMGLFLLPPMISVLLFLDVFNQHAVVLLLAIVGSTVLSLVCAFFLSQKILKRVELKLKQVPDPDE